MHRYFEKPRQKPVVLGITEALPVQLVAATPLFRREVTILATAFRTLSPIRAETGFLAFVVIGHENSKAHGVLLSKGMSILYAVIFGFVVSFVIYGLCEIVKARSTNKRRKDLDELIKLQRSIDEIPNEVESPEIKHERV